MRKIEESSHTSGKDKCAARVGHPTLSMLSHPKRERTPRLGWGTPCACKVLPNEGDWGNFKDSPLY